MFPSHSLRVANILEVLHRAKSEDFSEPIDKDRKAEGYFYSDFDNDLEDEGCTKLGIKFKGVGHKTSAPTCQRGKIIKIDDIAFITCVYFSKAHHRDTNESVDFRPIYFIFTLVESNLHRTTSYGGSRRLPCQKI